jgi:hypothetical protein
MINVNIIKIRKFVANSILFSNCKKNDQWCEELKEVSTCVHSVHAVQVANELCQFFQSMKPDHKINFTESAEGPYVLPC